MDAAADRDQSGIAFIPDPAEEAERWTQDPKPAVPPPAPGRLPGLDWFKALTDRKKDKKTPGRPLSDAEAKALKPDLVEAILGYAEYTDIMLGAINRDHIKPEIWGDMTEAQAGVIADWRLARARVSASAARSLEAAVVFHHTVIRVLLILGPRVFETILFMRQHPIGGIMPARDQEGVEDGQ